MTLPDAATARLWEALRARGSAELARDAVRLVLQELIEAEAAEVIGTGRYERRETRTTKRNGAQVGVFPVNETCAARSQPRVPRNESADLDDLLVCCEVEASAVEQALHDHVDAIRCVDFDLASQARRHTDLHAYSLN